MSRIVKIGDQTIDIDRIFHDFPYYCASLLKIIPKDGGLEAMGINSMQKILWYGREALPNYETDPRWRHVRIGDGWKKKLERKEPIREIVLKYRQAGMSTVCMALAFWYIHTHVGRRAMIIAHREDTTRELFRKIEIFFDELPQLFKPQLQSNNKKEMIFGTKGQKTDESGLMSAVATATAGDKGSAHGQTIHCLIASELSRWQTTNLEQVLAGLSNAVPSGMDAAGTIYIIETVANYAGDYFHYRYDQAIAKKSRFDPIFLPWYLHTEYREPWSKHLELSKDLLEMQKEFYLDDNQIAWYHWKMLETENDHPGRGDKMMRALYPGTEDEAFIGSGFTVFPDGALAAIQKQIKRPMQTMRIESSGFYPADEGSFRIYKKPERDRKYVIGADVGLGVGESDSTMSVLVFPGYEQVAEFATNTLDPKEFAHKIKQVGCYYNDALVAVEINNAGVLTNAELDEIYPSGNLYEWEVFNRRAAQGVGRVKKLGWQTSYETKELLVGHARSLLRHDGIGAIVRSTQLLSQLRTFIEQEGHYGHAANCRDDLVMAWLIALMAMWRKIARYELNFTEAPLKKVAREKPGFYYDDWNPGDTKEKERGWMTH